MITVCKTGNLPMAAPFNVTIIAMASSVFHICFHPIDEMLDFLVSILNIANNGLFNDSKWSIKDIQDFRQVGATKGCWKYFYPIDWYFRNFWDAPVWNTPNAVIQRNGNLGNSIFVHFEMTFWTRYVSTLTGILITWYFKLEFVSSSN